MPWLQLQSALGLLVLVLAAWALSENRRAAFSWRLIATAIGLQLALAVLLLQVPMARAALYSLNNVVDALSARLVASGSPDAPGPAEHATAVETSARATRDWMWMRMGTSFRSRIV